MPERIHQVALTRHIRTTAAKVAVWLGPNDENDVAEDERLLPTLD